MNGQPLLKIGQRTTRPVLEGYVLEDQDGQPINLSAAAEVTLTTQHHATGLVETDAQPVEITDANNGEIRYQFGPEEIPLDGRYDAQFLITYDDGDTQAVPPGTGWFPFISVARKLPGEKMAARFSNLRVDELTAASFSADEFTPDSITGTIAGGGTITRLDGPDLEITDDGALGWVDPETGGYTAGSDHDHSATGEGGDTLRPSQIGASGSPVQTAYIDTVDETIQYDTTTAKLWVSPSGDDANGGFSQDDALETVSEALERASRMVHSYVGIRINGTTNTQPVVHESSSNPYLQNTTVGFQAGPNNADQFVEWRGSVQLANATLKLYDLQEKGGIEFFVHNSPFAHVRAGTNVVSMGGYYHTNIYFESDNITFLQLHYGSVGVNHLVCGLRGSFDATGVTGAQLHTGDNTNIPLQIHHAGSNVSFTNIDVDSETDWVDAVQSTQSGTTTIDGHVSWHEGNDGIGSGLDADTVDGSHAGDLGGGSASTVTTSVDYTAPNSAQVLADASDGELTVTLPPVSNDLDVTIKKIDSTDNAVTIATPGSETIDGQSELSITNQYTSRPITASEERGNYFIL